MKTILYMAISANGKIAKNDDSAEFLTPLEAQSYVNSVIDAGALIVGRRTYEILSQQPEFEKFLAAGVKVVVLSQGQVELKDVSHKVANTPSQAVDFNSNLNRNT